MAGSIANRGRSAVLVRSTDLVAVAGLLRAPDVEVSPDGSDALTVSGLTTAEAFIRQRRLRPRAPPAPRPAVKRA